jgi:hypothetical protein
MSAGKAGVADLEISEDAKQIIEEIQDLNTWELRCSYK